jgi:hypothetical protein
MLFSKVDYFHAICVYIIIVIKTPVVFPFIYSGLNSGSVKVQAWSGLSFIDLLILHSIELDSQ